MNFTVAHFMLFVAVWKAGFGDRVMIYKFDEYFAKHFLWSDESSFAFFGW